ncbi:hypothetical protein SYJ56_21595 [Algoriphagus sp. D3-2-R+10]|uniref:hypothetical protein n=1 Tax=Algoriphagus aurantiacus TaxID=3103948 RepID=UPI002B3BB699|nr:hypothetical protein [Algoriphagus sp. D3-2-R+10]MEB2777923.1 hypothetical protein [Algoriphagus sp. D3-2-R+10]
MNKLKLTLLTLFSMIYGAQVQTIEFEGKEFELSNVKASVEELNGDEVLRIERDLEALPFDAERLEATVDEPTFVKLKEFNLENGIVEVKMLSRLLPTAPAFARGFIGLAFRVNEDNTAYESIYIRPTNGKADDQFRRNHTIQYYTYPDFNPDYALGFVTACPDSFREGFKLQENQSLWRSSRPVRTGR